MSSSLVGVSSDIRTLDERDLASWRPQLPGTGRLPRKPSLSFEVTSGIACFCGERFGEDRALEFMLHLRAEVGADLAFAQAVRDRRLARNRARTAEKRAFEADAYERERREERNAAQFDRRQERKRLAAERDAFDLEKYGRVLSDDERREKVDAGLRQVMAEIGEALRLKVTVELLATQFALGNGEMVTWGQATVEQHRERVQWLSGHADSVLETAARHEKAIFLIAAARVRCLADIPADEVDALQQVA